MHIFDGWITEHEKLMSKEYFSLGVGVAKWTLKPKLKLKNKKYKTIGIMLWLLEMRKSIIKKSSYCMGGESRINHKFEILHQHVSNIEPGR